MIEEVEEVPLREGMELKREKSKKSVWSCWVGLKNEGEEKKSRK